MGAENVFRTLNIKVPITYSKEILIYKRFFSLLLFLKFN